MPKEGKRSPFTRSSLPQPGESLREEAEELFFGKFIGTLSIGLTLAAVAAVEWFYRWMGKPVSPWFWTSFAAVTCVLANWQFVRMKPRIEHLLLGMRGERQVGRMLEDLRIFGYQVFHDIPGEGTSGKFNVDHVLIGPGGVFPIETKTWSMPQGRKAVIDYDGECVIVDGRPPDADPVAQARASADYVRDILRDMTGRTVSVRPVVLFPGWWVNHPSGCQSWVLNPRELRGYLKHEPPRLTRDDVALFAERLQVRLSAG